MRSTFRTKKDFKAPLALCNTSTSKSWISSFLTSSTRTKGNKNFWFDDDQKWSFKPFFL